MPPHLRSLLLTAALLGSATALVAGCGDSDSAAPAATAKPPTTQLRTSAPPTLTSRLQGVVEAGSPGVIAFVNDGDGVELHAAGVADSDSRRPLRATDRFRAGSNTKTFTATVALQLEHEGKLSLDDTVEHWLPGTLSYGEQVTVRQLLNMTGGVPDYVPALEPRMVASHADLTRAYSPRELVESVADTPDFEPGSSWNYSTTGYLLAGMIVERASGHSLGRELERRIFEPLAMHDTYLPGATTAIEGAHAHGYGELDGKLRDVSDFNASAGWAGGGAVTTVGDMSRFWRGLLGGKLLGPDELEAMKTTVPVGKGYPGSYGLGLFRWTMFADCGPVWGNGGDLPGFSSEFVNSEDGRVQAGIVVNVNPIPKAVAGEALGATKGALVANALHRDHC